MCQGLLPSCHRAEHTVPGRHCREEPVEPRWEMGDTERPPARSFPMAAAVPLPPPTPSRPTLRAPVPGERSCCRPPACLPPRPLPPVPPPHPSPSRQGCTVIGHPAPHAPSCSGQPAHRHGHRRRAGGCQCAQEGPLCSKSPQGERFGGTQGSGGTWGRDCSWPHHS